jgi:TonB family protein
MNKGFGSAGKLQFALLPQSRTPWTEFGFSFGTQSLLIVFMLWMRLLSPQILEPSVQTYRAIELVPTPLPVNHQPQPLRPSPKPVEVAKLDPPPSALRLPAAVLKPKVKMEDAPAPEVSIAPKKLEPVPATRAVIPKPPLRTNVFSTGSSAAPTVARAPQQVQTGGFGDPNGVPAKTNDHTPVNIAQSGNFDLPTGPGYGNGTAGAIGVRGVVASAGFGNGVAIPDSKASASQRTVQQAGFGDTAPALAATTHSHPADSQTKISPAEVVSKPTPVYTDEARRLRIQGEVLLEVVLQASGQLHVVRVVRGLGHGLDDAAIRAAEQIRFKPALRDGQPTDSTAVLHIIFQLA